MRSLHSRVSILATLLLQLFIFYRVSNAEITSLHGAQSISAFTNSEEKVKFLIGFDGLVGYDLAHAHRNFVDVFVDAANATDFKKQLEQRNITYRVNADNLEKKFKEETNARIKAQLSSRFSYFAQRPSHDRYSDYDGIIEQVRELVRYRSNVARMGIIGYSYERRPIYAVKIGKGEGGVKPAIVIDAGIHAREWIAPAAVLYFIDQLLTNQTNYYMYEKVDWYIIPVLNPDGYQFTHSSSENRLWRKTRSPSNYPKCPGTDANRNFDLAWMAVGASSYPCAQTYAGPRAFSEPEARALKDFILLLDGTAKLYLSFHSYGQYILYPWGFTHEVPENEKTLRALASSVSKAIYSVYGTKYVYGTSANALYPAAGGSDDWAMGRGGVDLAYTIELPGGGSVGFDMPPSQIKRVGYETFQGLKVFHHHVEVKYGSYIWH
ncbi:carboxypeptidase B-like [Prorops nasuta]|uniref:carboxypeptidase B-like n=1 Tax=Prorops nasuta TaxID=863751 RepID=UPI0034CD4852